MEILSTRLIRTLVQCVPITVFFSTMCMIMNIGSSVTSKKLPNVYKSCPTMISLEKCMILTPLQKLQNNVGDLGKIIVDTSFECLPK